MVEAALAGTNGVLRLPGSILGRPGYPVVIRVLRSHVEFPDHPWPEL